QKSLKIQDYLNRILIDKFNEVVKDELKNADIKKFLMIRNDYKYDEKIKPLLDQRKIELFGKKGVTRDVYDKKFEKIREDFLSKKDVKNIDKQINNIKQKINELKENLKKYKSVNTINLYLKNLKEYLNLNIKLKSLNNELKISEIEDDKHYEFAINKDLYKQQNIKRYYKFQLLFIEEAELLFQYLKQIKSFINKPDILKTLLLNNKIKFYPDKNLIKRRQVIINILKHYFLELETYEKSIFDNVNNIKNYEKVLKFTDDKEEIISQIDNLKELNKSLSQKVEVNKQYIDKFNKELVQIHDKILNLVTDKYIIKLMNEIDNSINLYNYKHIKKKIYIKVNKKNNKIKNSII